MNEPEHQRPSVSRSGNSGPISPLSLGIRSRARAAVRPQRRSLSIDADPADDARREACYLQRIAHPVAPAPNRAAEGDRFPGVLALPAIVGGVLGRLGFFR